MTYDEFGLTSRETSINREAPNRHIKGNKKYKAQIDKDSKSSQNLPYSFSSPKKQSARTVLCQCPGCLEQTLVTKNTVIIVCSSCKKMYDVDETTTVKD